MQQRTGQLEGRSVAVQRQPGQVRTAGIRQAHQLGRLVEGLAGRVVDGFAEQLVTTDPVHAHQLRMAARHQQRDKRKLGRVGAEKWRQQVAFQVMHAHCRLAQRGGQRAGHAGTDQQRARQARAARVGHHIDIGQRALRALHDLLCQRQHAPNVVATGQFRHHAAKRLVHDDLAVQRMRQQTRDGACAGVHQRHAGFIAT